MLIKKLLREALNKTITCDNCGWSWKKSDSGPDMYFCHKCGKDNTPNNIQESSKKISVGGVLVKCSKTDKILLLLRNDKKPTWSLVSGHIEKGETIIEGLKREVNEEMSIDPDIIDYKFIRTEHIKEKNLDFHYYEGLTSSEFTPTLDNENLEWNWYDKESLPTPLFKGMEDKIKDI